MTAEVPDTSFMSWIVGLIGTGVVALSGLFGHVHYRIAQHRTENREDNKAIWFKLDKHDEQFLNIASGVATKEDIRQMEARLMQAIQQMPGRG